MKDIAPLFQYRAIWLSDMHLGTRGCKAEYLLDFPPLQQRLDDLPGRRHRRWLASAQILVLATVA